MDASTIFSALGLVFAVGTSPIVNAEPKQTISGTKVCDKAMIQVLHREDKKRVYIKFEGRVYALIEKTTTTGAQRYESADGTLVFIQIPTHAMILNQELMVPILKDCKNTV